MSLPKGVAKSDSGFLFIVREPEELADWTDGALLERLRRVKAYTTPDGGGLDYISGYVRTIALEERRALVTEIDRRARVAQRSQ